MGWQGDSIELFFDVSSEPIADTSDARPGSKASLDGYFQIFIMPVDPRRPAGIWQRGATVLQSAAALRGAEVAWTPSPAGYQFEAKIPLVNLDGLTIESGREIGLDIAFNDFDEGEPRDNGSVYMVWSGPGGPVNRPNRLGRLVFSSSPNDRQPLPTDSWERETRLLVTASFLLALILLGLLVSRLAPRIASLRKKLKLLTFSGLVLGLLLLWLIPTAIDAKRESSARQDFTDNLNLLGAILEEIQGETLPSSPRCRPRPSAPLSHSRPWTEFAYAKPREATKLVALSSGASRRSRLPTRTLPLRAARPSHQFRGRHSVNPERVTSVAKRMLVTCRLNETRRRRSAMGISGCSP